MAKRQIGKCEAIYRAIPSFKLQMSNIACTFVQSGYPENQSKYLRKVQPKGKAKNQLTQNSNHENEFENYSDSYDDFEENEVEVAHHEKDVFKISGRKGFFKETEKIHDKYAARPDGVKYLTLSQFATSYAKTSKKPEDIKFNEFGVTEERGQIIDHLTEEPLPRYIR